MDKHLSLSPSLWKQLAVIKRCELLPIKRFRVTSGHVSVPAGARASSTIRSSQGLHTLLSSACFTHWYWFFIDLRSPPVPPLLIHHHRLGPHPFSECKVKKEARAWHWFLHRLFSPPPSISVLVLRPCLLLSRTANLSEKAASAADASLRRRKGAEAVSVKQLLHMKRDVMLPLICD